MSVCVRVLCTCCVHVCERACQSASASACRNTKWVCGWLGECVCACAVYELRACVRACMPVCISISLQEYKVGVWVVR